MASTAARLSAHQRAILRNLLVWAEWAEGRQRRHCLPGDPAPVLWLRKGGDKSPAGRASFSRALRRLERRGLVLRTSANTGLPDGPRKGDVRLTPAGREVAKRLT